MSDADLSILPQDGCIGITGPLFCVRLTDYSLVLSSPTDIISSTQLPNCQLQLFWLIVSSLSRLRPSEGITDRSCRLE